MDILTNVNLHKNQLLDALLQMIAGDHGSPVEALIWYDSVAHAIKFRDNLAIQTLATTGASGVPSSLWDAQSTVVAITDNTPIVQVLAASTILGRKAAGNIGAMTMAELITELLAVDGAASLLDADLLDAQQGTWYLDRANHSGSQSADSLTDGTTNKAFLATERTKLTGIATGATANATDANLRDRATHTGTQLAATVSDFATAVRLNRLDQMAAPTAAVPLGGQQITGLANGTVSTDAATFGQLSALTVNLAWKDPVRAATTVNIANLLTGAPNILDGVALAVGDRVLAKNQTTGSTGGIYTVTTVGTGANGVWARSADMDLAAEANNASVMIEEGAVGQGDVYTQTATIVTIGTTAMVWTKISEGNQTYTADGTTVTLTGSQFGVPAGGIGATQLAAAVAGNGLTGGAGTALAVGVGTGLSAAADAISIDTAVVVRKFAADCAAATSTVVTHNLNTRDVHVHVYRGTTPWDTVLCDVERTSVNTVTVRFAVAPTAAEYRIVVQG